MNNKMKIKCGGISVQGSYHKENQDEFFSGNIGGVNLIMVADGLGSRPMSRVGAKEIILAAKQMLQMRQNDFRDKADFIDCLYKINEQWLINIAKRGLTHSDCSCTCLLCVVQSQAIYAARLGDGIIGICYDDITSIIYDDKQDHFANETNCLKDSFYESDWEIESFPCSSFQGALLCTDGVTIAHGKRGRFVNEFIEKYADYSIGVAEMEIVSWLADWKSNDDKTIAFALSASHDTQNNGADINEF